MKTIKEILNDVGVKTAAKELTPDELKRLQGLLLQMCKDIFDFCEEKNLCCMLSGGTALGAVRHQGFIPWDDDADLMMPREDYNRFSELFSKEKSDRYEVLIPDGKHRVDHAFMRVSMKGTVLVDALHIGDSLVSGVVVDIFPIDNIPSNRLLARLKGVWSYVYLRSIVSVCYFENRNERTEELFRGNWKTRAIYRGRCLLGRLLSFKPYQWWFCRYDRFVQCKKDCGYYTISTGRKHYLGEIQPRDVFFPPQKCSFEGCSFYIPNRVDAYLTRLYGDYMPVPPPENRERHFYMKIEI